MDLKVVEISKLTNETWDNFCKAHINALILQKMIVYFTRTT